MTHARSSNIEILEADALTVHFDPFSARVPGTLTGIADPKFEKVRVIGNIPYYITSELLLRLLANYRSFRRSGVLMSGVADRIAAEPGGRDYGLLSATADFIPRWKNCLRCRRGRSRQPRRFRLQCCVFFCHPVGSPYRWSPAAFVEFLKLSLGQKRKTLLNNLREITIRPLCTGRSGGCRSGSRSTSGRKRCRWRRPPPFLGEPVHHRSWNPGSQGLKAHSLRILFGTAEAEAVPWIHPPARGLTPAI